MKSSKAGRKPKYTDEVLINLINEYLDKNPFEKLKVSKLAKETGVPYYIWRDNEKVQTLIKSLNSTSSIPHIAEKQFELPSADDIVSKHYGNKARLTQNIQSLLDLVSDMYADSIKINNLSEIEKNYQDKVRELEQIIKQKDSQIENLNNEIDRLYLDSGSSITRKEKGLKKNLIAIDPANLKTISKNLKEIEQEFEGLFD